MIEGVRNIVAVASGKGGVGKSTTAINIALALERGRGERGKSRVGVLDADVYGPSMAMMMGVEGRPSITEQQRIIPLEGHGVKVISMAFLSDPDKPVIWRGPMVHGLLQQFVNDVEWGELDYLIVDLPPGTGDAQLSLSQVVSLAGVVIVTTPQQVSLLDARKGLLMFRQMKVPVLGMIENMSYFACPDCGKRYEIFRHGGARVAAEELSIPFLGEVPLDPQVVLGGDEGRPVVEQFPDSPTTTAYHDLADRIVAGVERADEEGKPSTTPIMPGPIDWK